MERFVKENHWEISFTTSTSCASRYLLKRPSSPYKQGVVTPFNSVETAVRQVDTEFLSESQLRNRRPLKHINYRSKKDEKLKGKNVVNQKGEDIRICKNRLRGTAWWYLTGLLMHNGAVARKSPLSQAGGD